VAYLIAARQKADHRMIADATTNIAGIEIPSINPIFLAGVGIHILLGLGCVVTGAVAMLSPKRAGRHPRYGTIYFWCLAGIFVTASGMAVARWAEDYHLFILGTLSFVSAYCGREARRQRWRNWARSHITGMGTSTFCSGCLLRGQRQAIADLERPTPFHLLAIANRRRRPAHCPCGVLASAGKSTQVAIVGNFKLRHYPDRT
jgi:hypothetical protein